MAVLSQRSPKYVISVEDAQLVVSSALATLSKSKRIRLKWHARRGTPLMTANSRTSFNGPEGACIACLACEFEPPSADHLDVRGKPEWLATCASLQAAEPWFLAAVSVLSEDQIREIFRGLD